MNVEKSGEYKDMGSPYRETVPSEKRIFETMIRQMAGRFLAHVQERRTDITEKDMAVIRTARIFTAEQALELHMIDAVGYMDDVIAEASGNGKAKVIVYRRDRYGNDNPYIMQTSMQNAPLPSAGRESLEHLLPGASARAGCYYLWSAVLP